jgi:hypothetical protein
MHSPRHVLNAQTKDEVADPECRQVAAKAHATLMRVGGEGKAAAPTRTTAQYATELLAAHVPKAATTLDARSLEFVVQRVQQLADHRHFAFEDWTGALTAFLTPITGADGLLPACQKMALKAEDDAVSSSSFLHHTSGISL